MTDDRFLRVAVPQAAGKMSVGVPWEKNLQSSVRIAVSTASRDTLPFSAPTVATAVREQKPEASRVAWIWRDANLTTIAAGCAAALLLHTGDSLFLARVLPTAIAGSAPHIFPPLGALLLCASLAVTTQRNEHGVAFAKEGLLGRWMLMAVAFSLAWTVIEGVLRVYGLLPGTRRALPLEVLFTGVAIFFYLIASGQLGRWLRRGDGPLDVLIVGTEGMAEDVRQHLAALPEAGYRFRGFIQAEDGEGWSYGERGDVAGGLDELAHVARKMFIDEVIVATRPSLDVMERLCEQARRTRLGLRFVPSVSEGLRRSAEVEYVGGLPTIVMCRRGRRPVAMVLKRALDVLLAGVTVILLSPVFLAIALAIKLQSDGPVLYVSERVGVRGRGFPCFKFRTMVPNADALRSSLTHLNEREGVLFKISKDPRITPLGAKLRKYSLDELPQLFNVLRGEMSLVGPRPSLRTEVLQYEVPDFRRLDVIPGMTGLWQVEARHDPSFESYVALDCKYADEWSIGLDLSILLRTFRTVLRGTGV